MKNKNFIPIIVIFIVSLLYNFPALLGMVDTPFDIRDVRMYPWRYHNVDQKIQKETLWEGKFPKDKKLYNEAIRKDVFKLQVLPGTSSQIAFNINVPNISKVKKEKLSDFNFYLSFDYKEETLGKGSFKFGLSLLNTTNGTTYTPGFAVLPLSVKSGSNWYRTTFNLNKFVNELLSIDNINNYRLIISGENNDKISNAYLYLTDIKLLIEDFSFVPKVHNHFNNDLIQFFTPAREYYSNTIKKLKLPFWNNYTFTGSEFLAEPQIGFFHPLYFLIYFVFDHFTAHQLITFLMLFLCGIGAFVLSAYWGLNPISSLLASIVYMFQPANATWYSYEHTLMNTAMLPFLIYGYERHLEKNRLFSKYLLFAALIMGLIFLSGHLQRVYYSIIFFVLFAVFKLVVVLYKTHKVSLIYLTGLFFVLVMGVLIGAVVVVPFIPLYLESHRAAIPDSLIEKTSIPFNALFGIIYPFYSGVPEWPLSGFVNKGAEYVTYRLGFMRNYLYFGLIPFFCLLFSFKFIKQKKIVLFFISVLIFSLLICTGTPLFYFLREILPGFKAMQHYKFLFLYSLSVPFLAGFGFDYLLSKLQKNKLKSFILIAVILITTIDLMYFSSYFVTWSKRSGYKPLPNAGVLQVLKKAHENSKEPFRILPFVSHKVEGTVLKPDIAEPNTLMPYEIEEVSGYSSFIPKDLYYLFYYIQLQDKSKLYSGEIFDLFSNFNTPYPISNYHSKILDLLNVKYFIVPNFFTVSSSKLKKIYQNDCALYLNKDSLPRAFVVPNYKVIEDPKETIVYLDSEEFAPRETVILMSKSLVIARSDEVTTKQSRSSPTRAIEIASGSSSPRNDIEFLEYKAESIKLSVKTNQAGFLVLGHNLNNNWKVKVNGKAGKHIQANLVQRAVYLQGPGNYKVEFYYYPKLFLIGGGITLFALFILFVIGLRCYCFTRD